MADDQPEPWGQSPVVFVREQLGVRMEAWQAEFLRLGATPYRRAAPLYPVRLQFSNSARLVALALAARGFRRQSRRRKRLAKRRIEHWLKLCTGALVRSLLPWRG